MPAGPLNTIAEAWDDPQVKARGLLAEVERPALRAHADQAARHAGGAARAVPPEVGEHTREVLAEAGFTGRRHRGADRRGRGGQRTQGRAPHERHSPRRAGQRGRRPAGDRQSADEPAGRRDAPDLHGRARPGGGQRRPALPDRHRQGPGLLRRRRPEERRAAGRGPGGVRPAAGPAGGHPRAGGRGGERLVRRRRLRAGAVLRHPHRLDRGEVRLRRGQRRA